MEKMSVTRALAQLKLLDARINKEIAGSLFVGLYTKRHDCINGTNKSKSEFEKEAKAAKQSIDDLIARRNKIKCAVLLSNSKVIVKIAGKDYYVIEAIERKRSIGYEQNILLRMKSQLSNANSTIEQNKAELQSKVDQMLKQSLSSDTVANKNDYDNISRPIFNDNELKMCDPINIQSEIDRIDKEIDEFISEVDFVLSESNSKTEIEI